MRKRKLLTFLDQFELLKKVKAGVPKEIILQYYDICPATYYRIIERKSEILKNINNFETRNRKSSKKSDEKILDDAVIKWYLQVRDSGDQLSMSMFKKKALELNRKLHGPSKFKVSAKYTSLKYYLFLNLNKILLLILLVEQNYFFFHW